MMTDNTTSMVQFKPPTLAEMSQDYAALVALKSIMRRGVDYGTIPGCGDKDSLFKPGAEKVLKQFMVHVVGVQVEDLSTADCIRYRVRCVGQTPDGITRGVGIGECSSDEDKYRWRKVRNNPEWEDTPDIRRRTVHKNGRNGTYTVNQVRTNPPDQANTVLKMGKKRAMTDLALTATAASEFFTQDLEDMPEELRQQVAAAHGARPADPFAPPPIDTTAEPVGEPTKLSPESIVGRRAKDLGLTGEDVRAVLEELRAPKDRDAWTVNQVKEICNALQARADVQGGHTDYDGGEPPPVEGA